MPAPSALSSRQRTIPSAGSGLPTHIAKPETQAPLNPQRHRRTI
jgi:hypothetical protein